MQSRYKLGATDKMKIRKLRTKILGWGKTHRRKFSWRKKPTQYSVLIAEFFLQRTKAKQAEKQFKLFLHKYPTFNRLKRASTKDLKKFLIPLGLKKRVRLLKKLIEAISKKYNGKIPTEYDDLKKLPGIGDYTASAILVFAMNKPAGIVDANTIKIFSDLFNLKLSREDGKKSKFIKMCAEYYSSLSNPRVSNWFLLDYAANRRSVKIKKSNPSAGSG